MEAIGDRVPTIMWKLQNNSLHRRLALVMLAASVACAGCGAKTPHSDKPWAKVIVSVTVGGQPLNTGEIAFQPVEDGEGVRAGGFLDAQGTATISALPGSYVAVIRPLAPPEDVAATASATTDATGGRSIPKRYRSAATSPFAVEIRQGEKNVFTFDLAP